MAPTTTSDKSTVPTETDPYESSELSDSSEAPSSESSSEEEGDEESDAEPRDEVKVENLRANRGKKPQMKLSKDDMGPDIRTFLKDFLPQLKAANDELEAERKAGTLKHRTIEAEGEEEGQYIEMVRYLLQNIYISYFDYCRILDLASSKNETLTRLRAHLTATTMKATKARRTSWANC
jgi:hypothetical protein